MTNQKIKIMEKYLKRLCKAILADRFNYENYLNKGYWHGVEIQTMQLFCSYGLIGFSVTVCAETQYEVKYDGEFRKLTIGDEPWKKFINILYLEDNDITSCGEEEFETYTDAGEDMIITLEEPTKECLQQYIDDFDIDEAVWIWWQCGYEEARKKTPFTYPGEQADDYKSYLKRLQKVCDKMPF